MNLVISPHTDDAIFSIGEFLTTMEDIVIVSPMAGIPEDDMGRIKHITLRAEHEEACKLIGAKVVNGDFLDDVYPPPTKADLDQWFKDLYKKYKPDNVYIPLGVHHPDHLMVTDSALHNSPEKCTLYIYEELPYRVLYPELRDKALGQITNATIGLMSMDVRIPTSAKESLVEVYQSQVDSSLLPKLMHEERIWKILV